MTSHISVGLNGDGGGGSKVLMLKPPGGDTHFSNMADAESDTEKIYNRVLRPPGGASSDIFGSDSSANGSATSSENGDVETPKKPYRMASSFEIGDEQPISTKPKKPVPRSINPLTGEMIGDPEEKVASVEPPVNKSGRVPPGGFSTPLW